MNLILLLLLNSLEQSAQQLLSQMYFIFTFSANWIYLNFILFEFYLIVTSCYQCDDQKWIGNNSSMTARVQQYEFACLNIITFSFLSIYQRFWINFLKNESEYVKLERQLQNSQIFHLGSHWHFLLLIPSIIIFEYNLLWSMIYALI